MAGRNEKETSLDIYCTEDEVVDYFTCITVAEEGRPRPLPLPWPRPLPRPLPLGDAPGSLGSGLSPASACL